MYDEQREDQGNNLLRNVVIGAGLLGAGALGANFAKSVFKNRDRKVQPVNVTVEQPTGQSRTQMRDLSALPHQTKAGVYERARQKYPDPGVGKDVEYRNPGSGGTDLSMLITDPNTGEVYRSGGGQSLRQSQLTPKPNVNLSKQNLGGATPRRAADNEFLNDMNRLQKNLGEANALESKLQRQQMPGVYQSEIDASKTGLGELGYVRNRIASDLEASPQSVGPNVQFRNLPPADRASQLVSEVSVDEMGRMTAGPEVAKETAQMTATESSRQSAAVKRMQDAEYERIAKQILAEQRGEGGQSVSQEPKPSGSGGPKLAGYSDKPSTLVEVKQAVTPVSNAARNEAVQTANDQSDSKFFKNLQRNEDVDLTIVNEDVLDKYKARAFDRLTEDAEKYLRDKQIQSEVDLKFDYTSEEARQAADVGAALERIRNNPKRVAAEGIIDELQAEGRAERDLARFQSEGEGAGELPGLKAEDNIRQRSQQQGSRSMTGEQLEEVLLGESKVIDTNMRGRALRGGKVNEEGNMFTEPGTVTYVGEGGAETGDFRDASTGVRGDIPFVASGPKTPEGAASILASEAIRKKYQNQRPEPLKGPAADVARSMQTLREGMSVEPSEVPPSTQVPTIHKGGYADGEAVIAVPPETAFTGDAADAAGPVLFTGKSKANSEILGTSPPLTQDTIVSNPQAAAANEAASQSFLQRAISGGLTQKAAPSVEEYKTPRIVGPAEAGPGRVPLSRSAVADPQSGLDPSQRTGYARYLIADEERASKPVGAPLTGAMTVGINYAELPQSTAYRPSDVGRTLPNLSANPAAVARTMSFADSEAPTRTVYRDTRTGYDYVAHPMQPSQVREVKGPKPIASDAGLVRMSVSPDPQGQYAPQALAGKNPPRTYPRMRGESLFPTGTLINDPNTRGGPVKFEGRERREDEYVRPISERLGRGDTMKRFPIIRRG